MLQLSLLKGQNYVELGYFQEIFHVENDLLHCLNTEIDTALKVCNKKY